MGRSVASRPAVRWVIAAALVLSASALGTAPTAAATGPTVIHGSKVGPISIPVTRRTVAQLSLPAGGWLVMAKAQLTGVGSSSHQGVDCQLKVGGRTDIGRAAPGKKSTWRSRVPMLLTAAGRLKAPGSASLSCAGEVDGAVTIRDVRMTAIKAGTLDTLTASGGKTTGSGSPHMIALKGPSSVDLWGDGTRRDVSWLGLPAGRWWVIAKAVYQGGLAGKYLCRLEAGLDFDELEFTGAKPGKHGDLLPLSLQVVHELASDGFAALTCRTDPDFLNHGFKIGDVAITAIRAGRLTNRDLATEGEVTSGSGQPRIISGWRDDGMPIPKKKSSYALIASLSLPAGRWSVLAKLWVEATADAGLVPCRLVFGSRVDEVSARYVNLPAWAPTYGVPLPMVMALSFSSIEPGPVELRCRRAIAGSWVGAYFYKITAIKSGTLKKLPL